MNILVLGGTGAMGVPLVNFLAQNNNYVYVTSRSPHESSERIKYLQGSAQNSTFLKEVLSMKHWDAVVDFMMHTKEDLKEKLSLLLDSTDQYIFISSSRVYAESNQPITEETPRLLEASDDSEYLRTNEYALEKAREEDILLKSGRKNFTIIRPSITYNTHRLQLGVLEKEGWLYRALHGRSIVFSEDINDKVTTNTWGNDVSLGIASLVGKEKALGETFHITCPWSMPWSDILSIYLKVLKENLGKDIPVIMTKKSTNFAFPWQKYQIIYCRYFNRSFDNKKLNSFCDTSEFSTPEEGLSYCLTEFLKNPKFQSVDWALEAINDRAAGERTPLHEISGLSNKVNYLLRRYNLTLLRKCIMGTKSLLRKILK